MDTLSSAAAQGEQAYEPHHADGYNFTGADPSVRTLEDAVRQLPSRSTRCSFRLHLDCEGLDARDRSSSMSSSPTSAGPQHLWWHASPARMVSRQHPPPFTGGSERVRNASHQTSRARRDL